VGDEFVPSLRLGEGNSANVPTMATDEGAFSCEVIVEAGRPCAFEFGIVGELEIETIVESAGDGPDGEGEVEAVNATIAGGTILLSGAGVIDLIVQIMRGEAAGAYPIPATEAYFGVACFCVVVVEAGDTGDGDLIVVGDVFVH